MSDAQENVSGFHNAAREQQNENKEIQRLTGEILDGVGETAHSVTDFSGATSDLTVTADGLISEFRELKLVIENLQSRVEDNRTATATLKDVADSLTDLTDILLNLSGQESLGLTLTHRIQDHFKKKKKTKTGAPVLNYRG